MTDHELAQIEERAASATPAPWYAHATDDCSHTNARYVSIEPSDFSHDNKEGLCEDSPDQAQPKAIIAITLLQSPRLATVAACDENTIFIAHARTDVPTLVAEVRRLRRRVVELENDTRKT